MGILKSYLLGMATLSYTQQDNELWQYEVALTKKRYSGNGPYSC